jgi:ABC-2 type transport system permease protein
VLTWKELLSLARSPRFRLVFMAGFTFGVIIFLPMMLRQEGPATAPWEQYKLTLVALYALLLLGDPVFWNIFGFDRSAAQFFFVAPQSFRWVLAAKNLAAALFVMLEVGAVALVWRLLRMPLEPAQVLETYAVTAIFCLYLMSAGNLASLYFPRAARPDQSMGATSALKVRILLLLAYPVLASPLLLAYGARYAFQSSVAFYLGLGFAAALGGFCYALAMDSAARRAWDRRELFLGALSQGEGPAISG